MVVRVATVAFEGIEARPVDVQVQIANGNVVFTVVASATRRSLNRAKDPRRA
jgi:magnesium chelatase family protein